MYKLAYLALLKTVLTFRSSCLQAFQDFLSRSIWRILNVVPPNGISYCTGQIILQSKSVVLNSNLESSKIKQVIWNFKETTPLTTKKKKTLCQEWLQPSRPIDNYFIRACVVLNSRLECIIGTKLGPRHGIWVRFWIRYPNKFSIFKEITIQSCTARKIGGPLLMNSSSP